MIIKSEAPFTSFSLQVFLYLYGTYKFFFIPVDVKYSPLIILREKKKPFFWSFMLPHTP